MRLRRLCIFFALALSVGKTEEARVVGHVLLATHTHIYVQLHLHIHVCVYIFHKFLIFESDDARVICHTRI